MDGAVGLLKKAEIIQLLKFLSSVFPTLVVTDDTIDAWFIALCDEDRQKLFNSARMLSKQHDRDFCPGPKDLLQTTEKKLVRNYMQMTAERWAEILAAQTAAGRVPVFTRPTDTHPASYVFRKLEDCSRTTKEIRWFNTSFPEYVIKNY